MVDNIRSRTGDAFDTTQTQGSDALGLGDDLITQGTDAASRTQDHAGDLVDTAHTTGASALETGQDTADDASDAGGGLFDKIKDKVTDLIDGGNDKP